MNKLEKLSEKQTFFKNRKTIIAENREKINEIISEITNLPQLILDNKFIYAKFRFENGSANDYYPVHFIKIQGDRLFVKWCNGMSSKLLPAEFLFKYVDCNQIDERSIISLLNREL